MRTIRTLVVPVLAVAMALAIGAVGAKPAAAGVIAPPQPGGLTGSVHFSCGRLGTPTVTVVVHNSYDVHFGLSIWADASPLQSLAVPAHSTRTATISSSSWEDDTVWIDVLRIGGVSVASGVHTFDCAPGQIVAPGTIGLRTDRSDQ
jgi:hypothetical protein